MGYEEEWKRFTMTGRIEDYLKYRHDSIEQADRELFCTDNDMAAIERSIRNDYKVSSPISCDMMTGTNIAGTDD
ncbi:MAG: hypothetical protein IJW18_00225 [Lachnospiraceae bacterium]|nr:hypothetical protein [Lachnospiraceae bacterium]